MDELLRVRVEKYAQTIIHSFSEIWTNRGSWCATSQSWIFPSHSSYATPGALENRKRRKIQQSTMRISISARFLPAQIVGPYEKGKNAAVLCSPGGAPLLNHRSGRNASGVWKLRPSRCMLYVWSNSCVHSGMTLSFDPKIRQIGKLDRRRAHLQLPKYFSAFTLDY